MMRLCCLYHASGYSWFRYYEPKVFGVVSEYKYTSDSEDPAMQQRFARSLVLQWSVMLDRTDAGPLYAGLKINNAY